MDDTYKPGQLPYPEQDDRRLFCKFHYKGVLIVLIPLLFAPILLGAEVLAYRMLYLTICIYLYYVFNVIPMGAIAFLFIVFVPICGITSSKPLCMAHYPDLIFVTFGCVFMGVMMDVSKLSDRLGMMVIGICGTNLRVLQLVIMMLTTVTAIFIEKSFVAAFFMKVAQSVITEYGNAGVLKVTSDEETYERQSQPYPSYPVIGIFLTVGYSATLGAMVSPFQDPTGVVFNELSPFMTVNPASFPIMLLAPMILTLIVLAIWINIIFLGLLGGARKQEVRDAAGARDTIRQAITNKRTEMGGWSLYTILALVMIIITAMLLCTRRPLVFKGWDDAISIVSCGASVPIIFMCILYFAVPANCFFCRYYQCRRPDKAGTAPSLVGWKAVNINTPWGHLFMLASGYGFITGYRDSKLLKLVSTSIVNGGFGKGMSMVIGVFLGTFITMLAPATGLARGTLHTMVQTGVNLHLGPGAIALSYAAALHNQFLLPCSTSSNTIVSGWGNIRPFQFLLGGIVPAISLIIFMLIFIPLLAGSTFPDYLNTDRDFEFTEKPPK